MEHLVFRKLWILEKRDANLNLNPNDDASFVPVDVNITRQTRTLATSALCFLSFVRTFWNRCEYNGKVYRIPKGKRDLLLLPFNSTRNFQPHPHQSSSDNSMKQLIYKRKM